ncbi:hypothetical protein HY493_01365 [Candidatus Woesearchaeota archaeon]|nr:hypothetical protein [Candidatus Woesearchaeota archaeon]
MAFGEGWFTAVPNMVLFVVHAITVLIALYFLVKSKEGDKLLMWAFGLYLVPGVLFMFVHLGYVDSYTTHILEVAFILVAFILVGKHAMMCK